MAGSIQVYTGDTLSAVEHWVHMDEAERRRRATEAARDRDPIRLYDLTRAHMILHGSKGAHLSKHTERAYAAGIRFLCADWSDVSLLHPSRDRAALYLRTLETRGLSTSTITVRLAAARALYRALRWARVTDADPLSDIRPASDPTPAHEKRRPYETSEVNALLEMATVDHDRTLILLASHAGLRVSECLAIEWPDISLSRRELTVKKGKGSKLRRVPLSLRLTSHLAAIRPDPPVGRLIPYTTDTWARQRIKRLCQQAGVDGKAIHAFRHTCGTRIIAEGGELQDAANMLGHSNLETTRVYAKWSDEKLRTKIADW